VAAVIGVLSAVGYVGVLLSTVLGGPTIQSSLLPLPAAPSPAAAAAQHPKVAPTGSTVDPAQPRFVAVASIPTAPPSSSATPSPGSTSAPTAAAPTAVPTAAAPTAAATKAQGKPTALPTPTNRPTKTAR